MSAYIRSKITNTEDDIVIQLGTTTTIRTNFSDDVELDGKKIVGLAVPETNSGAATKGYVDTEILTTKNYIDTSISNLVDGAPLVLDTLNELAAAIGDNANFVTDVNTSIASKLPLAGGTLTGELILNDNPVSAFGAATKEYVDNLVNGQMIYSTSDVPEGSGLYYTEARARDAISVSGSLSYDSEQGIISYTTPVANISSLSDVDTITRAPVVGEALVWSGENWVPGASVTAVLADASLDGGSFD